MLANTSRDIPITTEYENFYLLAGQAYYVNVQVMEASNNLYQITGFLFFFNKKGLYIDFTFTIISKFTVMWIANRPQKLIRYLDNE